MRRFAWAVSLLVLPCVAIGCASPATPPTPAAPRSRLAVIRDEQPGSVRLDGLAPIRGFAKGRDHTFIHCLELVLQGIGRPRDYDELMGISGLAFRLQFRANRWDVSDPDPIVGGDCVKPLMSALGLRYQTWVVRRDELSEADQLREAVVHSIGREMPVLAANIIPPEDWGIITGFMQEGRAWKCRSYNGGAQNIDCLATGWPTVAVFITGIGAAIPPEQAWRESITRAIGLFEHRASGAYALGANAFDHWCEMLRSARKPEYVHANAWTYVCLIDAREAAGRYLRMIAERFGNRREFLLAAADAYEQEAALLTRGLPDVPSESQFRYVMPPAEMRTHQIATLQQAKRLESQAIEALKKAVGS